MRSWYKHRERKIAMRTKESRVKREGGRKEGGKRRGKANLGKMRFKVTVRGKEEQIW